MLSIAGRTKSPTRSSLRTSQYGFDPRVWGMAIGHFGDQGKIIEGARATWSSSLERNKVGSPSSLLLGENVRIHTRDGDTVQNIFQIYICRWCHRVYNNTTGSWTLHT